MRLKLFTGIFSQYNPPRCFGVQGRPLWDACYPFLPSSCSSAQRGCP